LDQTLTSLEKQQVIGQAFAVGNDYHLGKTSSGDTGQFSAPAEGEQVRLRSEVQFLIPNEVRQCPWLTQNGILKNQQIIGIETISYTALLRA
jgi:hypothetical protein